MEDKYNFEKEKKEFQDFGLKNHFELMERDEDYLKYRLNKHGQLEDEGASEDEI